MDSDIVISERIQRILPFLNEKQQRIHLESEAADIGWGGVSKISHLSGISSTSIEEVNTSLLKMMVMITKTKIAFGLRAEVAKMNRKNSRAW